MAVLDCAAEAGAVAGALEELMSDCVEVTLAELESRSRTARLLTAGARLMAPLL